MLQLYRGDLLPKDSWDILSRDDMAYLIDIRTAAERYYVGEPDLSGLNSKLLKIEWRILPNMDLNADFENELLTQIPSKSANLFFLCRTGGRSMEAANKMASLGLTNCFNILHGFEGDLDTRAHRGCVSGWKADNLPWRQD